MRNQSNTLINLKRTIEFFPRRWLLSLAIFLTLVLAGIAIWMVHLLRRIIDNVMGLDNNNFTLCVWMIVGGLVVQAVVTFFRTKIIGIYTESGIASLRQVLADHICTLPISVFEAKHSGDYLSRLTNDVAQLTTFISQTLINVIYRPLTAAGALVYLLIWSWKLTLLTIFLIPLILIVGLIFSKPLTKYGNMLQAKLAELNIFAQDNIAGVEIVRAYNLQEQMKQKYSVAVLDSVNIGKKLSKSNTILEGFSTIVSIVPYIVCFSLGGYWVIKGEISAGGLIAYINLLNYLTFPLSMMPVLFGQVRSGMVSAGRLFEITNIMPERDQGEEFSIYGQEAVIEFEQVRFGYNQDTKMLNSVSFSIKAGERVALVGSSGSGKSTILKLLTGNYESFDGTIKLWGHSIRDWNLPALRKNISLVSQDSFLFPESISENIHCGNLEKTVQEVIEVAKAANAHDFILKLENKYETNVGELGDKISGGQKQRIALARAMLKDAPLLLLDEATSSLDQESERTVQDSLEQFMSGRTTLIVAHRLSTVINADRILVIDQGKIVEEGTHKSLLAQRGLYAKLYSTQVESLAV